MMKENKKKDIENIYYNLGVGDMEFLETDKITSYLICKTVQQLPKDIQELIINNNIIFMYTDNWGVVHTLDTKEKDFIYLIHLNINKIRSEEKKMYIIAHEIGHVVSEIKGLVKWGDSNGEKIADDLAREWGFPNKWR